jgi:hypothetical protein
VGWLLSSATEITRPVDHTLSRKPILCFVSDYYFSPMSRPRRSTLSKTGGRQNMVSWEEVIIEGSEQDSDPDDESTDFGSDEIYSTSSNSSCSESNLTFGQ